MRFRLQPAALALGLAAPFLLFGQAPPDPYARAREAMEQAAQAQRAAVEAIKPAVAKQLESAARQREAAGPFRPPSPAPSGVTPLAAPESLPAQSYLAGCDPIPAGTVESLTQSVSEAENVSPALLTEVMRQESGFRPCAVSAKGAMGLMQLMPATARGLGVSDPFDPDQNLRAGARYLRWLMNRYDGNTALVLGAYNAGPGRVDAAGGVPAISETTNYVTRILNALTAREPVTE